jgi:para-aminobenzoate synthetase / 4-amino-4-deoxychorismate lyase
VDTARPFVLFDDARPGAPPARLYREPVAQVCARNMAEVRPALDALRRALAAGRHLAGFVAYEAGYALDPALAGAARQGPGPLLWFGEFDGYDKIDAEQLGALLGDPAGARVGNPRPRMARKSYLEAAGRVREHLFAGDFYQANLTFGCDVPLVGAPLAAYSGLRRRARAGWGGIVRHPDGWLLSLSPEQFFRIRNDLIDARPMKGTARRLQDPAADRGAAEALAADPKQRAENLMIVDLLRNDLARIAEPGSVAVPELFTVERYPTVHQMVSAVTARLRPGVTAVDVLETIFPCGSVTGAPKIAAMLHLAELEPEPRGAYTGSMGWIDPNGDASFNVLIRTLELDRRGGARLGLGSGLVADSVAEDEWAECLLKGKFVSDTAAMPDLVETMRFDPEEGVVELHRHLARLRRSAESLGFGFDHHAARNELQAATFGKKRPAVARLLLSPTGAMAIEVRPIGAEITEVPVKCAIRPLPVAPDDYRLRNKTTDRRFYDDARRECGLFEVVFTDPDGFVTEGSFTTVFVERDGILLTPPLTRGILPGILREKMIDEGRAREADLRAEDLSDGFLIGNMVRGMLPAQIA